VNSITELVDIINSLGGEAALNDICLNYQKKYKDALSQNQRSLIIKTLNENPKLVFLNGDKKWEVITEEKMLNVSSSINKEIQKFKKNSDESHFIMVDSLRKKFIDEYPVDRITNLTLDEYIFAPQGHGHDDSFCRKISYGLIQMASIGQNRPDSFGIYLKEGKEIKLSKTFSNMFGNDYQKAFKHIKELIVKFINEMNKKNYSYISECKLNSFLKYRLLIVYFGDKFVPVTASDTISGYCKALNIKHFNSEEIIDKNIALQEAKNRIPALAEMNNIEFMAFCDQLWRKGKVVDLSLLEGANE